MTKKIILKKEVEKTKLIEPAPHTKKRKKNYTTKDMELIEKENAK